MLQMQTEFDALPCPSRRPAESAYVQTQSHHYHHYLVGLALGRVPATRGRAVRLGHLSAVKA